MKTQQKIISCFAAVAIAFAGLCLTASVRAQEPTPGAPQPFETPYANKKEAPNAPAPAPTPTPTPKK